MTEYHKVKTQICHAVDFDQAELVIKSTLVRKLAFQTFDKICDLYVTHDFTLKQMKTGIQHIIDKLKQATLALGEKANVKPVGVSSQQTNQQPNQQNRKSNHECSYCSGSHFTNECTKYKTVNARKDRVMALKLCFNCLKPGHSSKTCRSNRTCRTCGLHHHSSLSINASSSNSSNRKSLNPSTNSNANSTVVSQGKSNQSSNRLVAVIIVVLTQHHKHNHTPTNPLLHQTKAIRVNQVTVPTQVINLTQLIPHT